MSESPHKEHRKRMKERFVKHGLSTFHDHEVIEMLLYYSFARGDTNPLAHRLIDTFGSLHAVLEASPSAIEAVDGAGSSTAIIISFFRQLMNRYATDKHEFDLKNSCMETSDIVAKYLQARFIGFAEEHLIAMATDIKGKVLGVEEISQGTPKATTINIRKIAEFAFRYNASCIILAHNHPGGLALPSYDDVQATRMIEEALKPLDIVVRDHIVVADDDFVSMRDSNMLQKVSIISHNTDSNHDEKHLKKCAATSISIVKTKGEQDKCNPSK